MLEVVYFILFFKMFLVAICFISCKKFNRIRLAEYSGKLPSRMGDGDILVFKKLMVKLS